jgi:hypothetical protein
MPKELTDGYKFVVPRELTDKNKLSPFILHEK